MARLLTLLGAALILLLAACAPATPTPTPTSLPSPSPTVTPAATLVPSPTLAAPTRTAIPPTATGTATAAPTLTATNTPAPATATRVPTSLLATPTPQPVADTGQAPPACPMWFATPPAGKAALLFENNVREEVIIENLPGLAGAIRLPPATSDGPSRTTVAITAGTYELTASASSGSGTVKRTIASGEMHLIRVSARNENYCCPPGSVPHFDLTQSTLPAPWGCPGGQPPSRPLCPAWFMTPPADQAVIVIENRRWSGAVVEAQNTAGKVFAFTIEAATDEGPIRKAFYLPAGRYSLNVQFVPAQDLAAGRIYLLQLPGSLGPLPIPPACPGFVAPTPPPPPTCPAWFMRPEPGKALLVVENHSGKTPLVTLKGMVGTNVDIQMPPKTGDEPSRYVLMLVPGHYELEASPYGMIIVDLAAGDMKVAPVYAPRVERRPVFDLPVPPACN